MRRSLAIALAATALAGCQTVTFARHSTRTAAASGEWHHNSVLALVEVSDPVDLKQRCPSGWSRVTTEESFLTGFVPAFLGAVVAQSTSGSGTTDASGAVLRQGPTASTVSALWDPEYVEVSCAIGAPQ
jgi:hypothetical protein